MMVVGLTGLATVGKSAVADILVRDYGFEKRSFAAPLKEMLRTLDPILGDDACVGIERLSDYAGLPEGEIKNGINGDEYRRLLQVLGTDCIRSIDDDFWINAARKTLTDPDGRYVFDDCRFPNEAQMIFSLVEYFPQTSPELERTPWSDIADVWHVTRPGVELGPDAHISEQHAGHMGETVTIINNGSLELLKETVDVAWNFFAAPRRWMEGMK
jgi:hypothetical protein